MTRDKRTLENQLHTYTALVRSVYDGDTIRADISLGLDLTAENRRIRLARINTPELKGRRRRAGRAARDYVRERIDGREVILQTVRDSQGRYGRYLAEVWYWDPEARRYVNLNDELLDRGIADPL
jgi:micrococcal nuclease